MNSGNSNCVGLSASKCAESFVSNKVPLKSNLTVLPSAASHLGIRRWALATGAVEYSVCVITLFFFIALNQRLHVFSGCHCLIASSNHFCWQCLRVWKTSQVGRYAATCFKFKDIENKSLLRHWCLYIICLGTVYFEDGLTVLSAWRNAWSVVASVPRYCLAQVNIITRWKMFALY